MKRPENINFESMHDLQSVLKRDISKLKYAHRQELIDLLKKSDKAITVHLYPVWSGRKRHECLMELNEWSYHQIYLCIYEGEIYYSLGHGRSSGMRENHNFFMDAFLKDKELRNKTMTAIIVSSRKDALAFYFYSKYAYCNHDIGSNWDRGIVKRMRKSGLPYSQISYGGFEKTEVTFKTKTEMTIYRSVREDIWQRKFSMTIAREMHNSPKS